jgi:hypothetical protein
MAARKKTITTTTEIPDTDTEFDLAKQIPDDDPLAEFDRQFPNANKKYKCARMTPNGTVHVFSTNEPFDEDFLQENYGGGRYVVRLFVDGVRQREVEMRVEDRQGATARTLNPETETKNVKPESKDSLMESLLLRLVANQQPVQSTTSVSELADALKAVHSITGNNNGSGNESKSYMEGFKAGIEMAKQFVTGESGDWKTQLIDAAKTVLPGVASAIGAARGTAPQPATPLPFIPGNKMAPQPQPMDEQTQKIYNAIQQLKQQCLNRVPVDLIIDYAVANAAHPETQNVIRATFNLDFAAFASIDPEIANEPFVTWFKNLYDGLRQSFNEADDMDDNPSGESGDNGNAVDHARSVNTGKSKPGDSKVS